MPEFKVFHNAAIERNLCALPHQLLKEQLSALDENEAREMTARNYQCRVSTQRIDCSPILRRFLCLFAFYSMFL
jgi:hypothetical protein